MANNDLSGTPTKAGIVSWLTELANAWRGALYPRNNDGSVFQLTANNADQAPDIGAQTSPFGVAYLTGLQIGGSNINLADLAEGSTVAALSESDAAYEWVFDAPTAVAVLVSGQLASGGGTSGGTRVQSTVVAGTLGGPGGRSRVRKGGVVLAENLDADLLKTPPRGTTRGTYNSVTGRYDVPPNPDNNIYYLPPGTAGRSAGIGSNNIQGSPGKWGGAMRVDWRVITGLVKGDVLDVEVGAGGARGIGGRYTSDLGSGVTADQVSGTDGQPGADGAVIFIPIGGGGS